MRKRIAEQTVLFISVLKWVAIATAIGSIVGLSTSGFLLALNAGTSFTGRFPYFFLLMPIAFLLSTLMIRYLAPEAEGHGTEKVIEAVHKRSGKIPIAVVPIKLTATVITLAAGGSAGKEGPCAQIGAGLASAVADLFRLDEKDRKKLVICGISAGFASVFGTPVAGAIFGVEVLFVGGLLYDVLLPSFISGITAYQVSAALGVQYFNHALLLTPVFHEGFFLKVVLSGIFFGMFSFLFIEIISLVDQASARIPLPATVKALLGGAFVAGIGLIFSSRFLGLGLDTIESALKGDSVPWYSFPVKALATAVTLSFGGSGGIVTPIFFLGSTSGSLFARFAGLDPATFAAIGLVGLLAGCANTPIAASIMAIELFGRSFAPYACVACVISFLMTGHRSVYPSQILSMRKSSSIEVPLGGEMDDVTVSIRMRRKSLLSFIDRSARRFREQYPGKKSRESHRTGRRKKSQ
jgi:H+/Cl- antiporter ClcA